MFFFSIYTSKEGTIGTTLREVPKALSSAIPRKLAQAAKQLFVWGKLWPLSK